MKNFGRQQNCFDHPTGENLIKLVSIVYTVYVICFVAHTYHPRLVQQTWSPGAKKIDVSFDDILKRTNALIDLP